MKQKNIKITLPLQNCLYEYSYGYFKPIENKQQSVANYFNRYEGLSLEEIKSLYGTDTAQSIFNLGRLGIDLTQPQEAFLEPIENDIITCYDFMIVIDDTKYGEKWSLYICNNQYTQEKQSKILLSCYNDGSINIPFVLECALLNILL